MSRTRDTLVRIMNRDSLLRTTLWASLATQIGILCVELLALRVGAKPSVVRELLGIDVVVQLVEMGFYVAFLARRMSADAMTLARYLDWVMTTPTQLVVLAAYFSRRSHRTVGHFVRAHWRLLSVMGAANLGMLAFGYAGETQRVPPEAASIGGFSCLLVSFGILQQFVVDSSDAWLFWFTAAVWTSYGAAARTDQTTKNVAYSVLDLVSKNALGLYLAWEHVRDS